MKIKKTEEPVLKAILYSDIFEYPLKEEEIWKYLISEKKIKTSDFKTVVRKINSVVFRKNDYLYLEKREETIYKRNKKNIESQIKLRLAKKIIKRLSGVPGVLFIGISGSLSMMNSTKKDDIDLFVIAKSGSIWTTRFFLISYLKILGLHRGRSDKKFSDKFCLNMIVDDKHLSLPKSNRNLYTAHEIAQLLPVISKKNTYRKFINSNKWVIDFLPNAFDKEQTLTDEDIFSFWPNLPAVEEIAKRFQILLIKKNKTTEKIREGFLAFHPQSTDKKILSEYHKKLVKYNLS